MRNYFVTTLQGLVTLLRVCRLAAGTPLVEPSMPKPNYDRFSLS